MYLVVSYTKYHHPRAGNRRRGWVWTLCSDGGAACSSVYIGMGFLLCVLGMVNNSNSNVATFFFGQPVTASIDVGYDQNNNMYVSYNLFRVAIRYVQR